MEDDYQIAMDAIKDQADGEYEAYHAAASEQQQWDQLQNELATLRAELAEARQHAEYQDKEIRQWALVCYVGTWPLSEEDTKNTGFYGRLAAKMTAERNTATARAEKAEAENAALKAHAERLRGDMEKIQKLGGNYRTQDEIWPIITTALADTPAQSLAAVKAEVLLDACKDREHGGLCQRVAVDYLDWTGKEPLASQLHARPMFRLSVLDADEVMKMAERLQAEAANGTT